MRVCTSHANTDKLRGSIKCGARDNYVRIFSFTLMNNLDLWLINYYSSQLRFAHQRAVSVWPLLCSVQVSMMFFLDESVCPRSAVDLDSGDELMPTKCPHSSHPSNLQDRTSAPLLTSPFHGGAESRVQIPELRIPMSPQMLHGPLSKHAAPHLRVALCRV